jgi:hypothetical protein
MGEWFNIGEYTKKEIEEYFPDNYEIISSYVDEKYIQDNFNFNYKKYEKVFLFEFIELNNTKLENEYNSKI